MTTNQPQADTAPLLNVTVGDGKYTVIMERYGQTHALRYGEPWRCISGDNLILSLAMEVERLRELLARKA